MEITFFRFTSSEIAAIDGALLDYMAKIKHEKKTMKNEDDRARAMNHYNAAKKARDEILK